MKHGCLFFQEPAPFTDTTRRRPYLTFTQQNPYPNFGYMPNDAHLGKWYFSIREYACFTLT